MALHARLGDDRRASPPRRRRPASSSTSAASPTRSPTTTGCRAKSSATSPRSTAANRRTSSSSAPTSAPACRRPGRSDTTILLRLDPDTQRDRGDVDPARPQGRNPRLRDRKVQRRLRLRRAEADPAGGEGTDRAADQPRRQRRLPRLRPRRRRDRLRLRRRRPPLLPLQRRPAALRTVFAKSTSSPATSCSAGKKRCEYVRYRHTDTDLVRSARQQDFLSAARQRVPIKDFLGATN